MGAAATAAPNLFLWQNEAIYGISPAVDWRPGPGTMIDLRGAKKA